MEWIYLTVAGLLEIGWAIGLKYTESFTRLLPSLWTIACMILSIVLLGLALKTLPRNRCGRNRGARHLSVRGTRDRVAADIHRLDPVRYRRPQAGHIDCWYG
jgi:hypothetical protein